MHWGGWSFRLKREDFHLNFNTRGGTSTGEGADWAIDYEKLEPFYSRAETCLPLSGDSSEDTVPRKQGYPFRPFPFTLQDQPLIEALKRLGYTYRNLPIARRGVSGVPAHQAGELPPVGHLLWKQLLRRVCGLRSVPLVSNASPPCALLELRELTTRACIDCFHFRLSTVTLGVCSPPKRLLQASNSSILTHFGRRPTKG